MKPMRRHQLVWLDEHAWYRILAIASSSDGRSHSIATESADCLAHWAQQRWPLVITRQRAEACSSLPDAALALGLAAPARWGRQAISVSAPLRGVARLGDFPLAVELGPELPAAAQAGWGLLCEHLSRLGVAARVYGSYGWQRLTGMSYVHGASDIDLLMDVGTAAQADQACAALRAAAPGNVRIDGELAFPDGAAVAWREWLRCRSGQTDKILVKRFDRATLEHASAWEVAA